MMRALHTAFRVAVVVHAVSACRVSTILFRANEIPVVCMHMRAELFMSMCMSEHVHVQILVS